jgi:hypothetical protein
MSFEESRNYARTFSQSNRDSFESFRLACKELFEIRVAQLNPPFKRKPSVGIRFKIDDDHMLVCTPNFIAGRKTVEPDTVLVELITQERLTRNGETYFRPKQKMKLRLTQCCAEFRRWYRNSQVDDSISIMLGMKRFVNSPEQAFSDRDHCALCGRQLIDGQSRSRGIGPECIQVVAKWPLYSSRSALLDHFAIS